MKEFFKGKFTTALVVIATVILAGVAIFTALRLYQLRQQPVAPTAPARPEATAPETMSCELLTFTITQNTPTPEPTGEPSLTPSSSPTPTEPPLGGTSPTPTVSPTSAPTTTPVPSPTPTFPPPPSIPEPPQCVAEKPDAPILTSVNKTGTQAVLTWTSVDLATHYVISYGTSPDNLQYGVPNTGNVTTYTVSSLNTNATYYFTVYAVNDCMPSEGSTIVSSVAGTSTATETGTGGELPASGISLPTLAGIIGGFALILLALALAL
jgi:hypothetical protein